MRLQLRLIETDGEIRTEILRALADEANIAMNRALPNIRTLVRNLVEQSLRAQPEYQALLAGDLRLELGIPDSASKVQHIISVWLNSMRVNIKTITPSSRGLTGGFTLEMIARDFSDVISLTEANVIDENAGYSLPWLKWLLLEGGNILVRDYQVKFGPSPYSRTGGAIMQGSVGANWRVPAMYAGTISNNWVTRAIANIDDDITTIIQNEFTRAIP